MDNITDKELQEIFDSTYQMEYENNSKFADEFDNKARDKKYAAKVSLAVVKLVYMFRASSTLEKAIYDSYIHAWKLGGSIPDVIRGIPDVIERHEKEKELKEIRKNKVTVVYKKFMGIPYGIKEVNVEAEGTIGSVFENLTSLTEMAEEFGKQQALFDIYTSLRNKCIELGALDSENSEDIESDSLLPVEFKNLRELKASLTSNDLTKFFIILKTVFASMSYNMKVREAFFHSNIHLALKLLGFEIDSEVETNEGRIDSVIETERYIHILEFKRNSTSVALEQIHTKKYYQRYLSSSKKIILVGVAVDYEKRNITDWQMQSYTAQQ